MSSKKEMTFISYYVPEDGDDSQSPNVFAIPLGKANLRLCHIYEYFPLKGTYIFRFKFSYDGFIVWLDLPDLEAKLPLFKDKVYIKASRVSWQDSKSSVPSRTSQNQKATSKQSKPQHADLFDNDHRVPAAIHKKQDKKDLQQNAHHIDILNQKPDLTKTNTTNINLLSGVNPHVNAESNIDFFSGMTSSVQPTSTSKKNIEINLMNSFEKHGDLI